MQEWELIPDMIDDEELARIMEEQEEEERKRWHITDDLKADWAVKKIKEIEKEHDRLIKLYEMQISELNEKIKKEEESKEKESGFFRFKLLEYFGTVESKETKTQRTYKLGAGSLVYTREKLDVKQVDTDKFVDFLYDNGMSDFVKVEHKPLWSKVKSTLTIKDGQIITEDGLTVPEDVLCIEEKPGEFKIK